MWSLGRESWGIFWGGLTAVRACHVAMGRIGGMKATVAKIYYLAKLEKWFRRELTLIRTLGIVAMLLGLARYTSLPHIPVDTLISLHEDLAPELIGIGLTVLLVDWAVERRQDKQLKEQLILQMGSTHNDVADSAARALRVRLWLIDGSLRGVNLSNANLKGVDLSHADLVGVNLQGANLEGANLDYANLTRSDLRGVNLQATVLSTTILQRASLSNANLQKSDLVGTQLQRANLNEANIQEARLIAVRLNDAVMWDVKLRKSDLSGAKLQGANLLRADLRQADFEGAKLQGANLSSTNCEEASFIGADLRDASFYLAHFQNTKFRGAMMSSGTEIEDWVKQRALAERDSGDEGEQKT